eukprot:gnl/Ergobibamus_cyprinoides/2205.p1 GENE.gnl/Ergobibamus_cyprinoides/2205~~gnl/Ergobibamus_cyprinoides/2205.p1  ORF type:complete len:164 (-),score=20.42 gnl/Ergobibamus_cyprinoides/2205:21-512(-)
MPRSSCSASPRAPTPALTLLHTLLKHTEPVAALQWAPNSDMLLSVAHDREGYVWIREGDSWTSQLVLLRTNRAAQAAAWAHGEHKFAVGTGTSELCVCSFDPEGRWWTAVKPVANPHGSTVTAVAFHPTDYLVATGCTDGHMRLFTSVRKRVDTKPNAPIPEP